MTRAGRVLLALCAAAAVVWLFAPPRAAESATDEARESPDNAQIRVAFTPPPPPPPSPPAPPAPPAREPSVAEPPSPPVSTSEPPVVVPSASIEQRGKSAKSSMPDDVAKLLTKQQLRDLIEYLSQRK